LSICVLAGLAVAVPSASRAGADRPAAHAYALSASVGPVGTGRISEVDLVDGPASATAADQSVGPVHARALSSSVEGTGEYTLATSETGDIVVTLAQGTVLRATAARSVASCSTVGVADTGATLGTLEITGQGGPYTISQLPEENTVVSLGAGSVVLRETARASDEQTGRVAFTENMIHITVPGVADVVVSSASCAGTFARVETRTDPSGTFIPTTPVRDHVTVSGSGPVPTGYVYFYLCGPAEVTEAGCPSGMYRGAEYLDASGAATGPTDTPTAPGRYCWRAEYLGDAVYGAISHTNATTECFTLEQLTPILSSSSDPSGTFIPTTPVRDHVTVSGSEPVPTGYVYFYLCGPAEVTEAGCPSGVYRGAEYLDASGAATGPTDTPTAPGRYCWRAEYLGDYVYTAVSHTNATTECFTLEQLTPSIRGGSDPSGTVNPGTNVVDKMTVSGSGPVPTGYAYFYLCGPAEVTEAGCPSGGSYSGSDYLDVTGAVMSPAVRPTTPGRYCWRAEYSGDYVYTAVSHTNATSQCFTVAG
jgi:hypothetical protein